MSSLASLNLVDNELSGELGDLTGLTRQLVNLTNLAVSQNHQLGGCKPRLQDAVSNDFHLFNLPFCPVSGDTTTARDAMVALYNLTGGAENRWARRDKWLTEAPVWEWYGVTADHNGRVTVIDLRNNQLSGEIPAELGKLTSLESLRLDSALRDRRSGNRRRDINMLSGEIPAEVGQADRP